MITVNAHVHNEAAVKGFPIEGHYAVVVTLDVGTTNDVTFFFPSREKAISIFGEHKEFV